MFRALKLFPSGSSEAILKSSEPGGASIRMSVRPDDVFATAVGPSAKRTLASWHVTESEEVVDVMAHLISQEN